MKLITSKRFRSKFEQINAFGNIYCYKCTNYKIKDDFDFDIRGEFRNFTDRRCKDCKKKQYLKRRASNRGKKDINRLLLERWHGLKERSNIVVDFNWDYLKSLWDKQQGLCALSGIPMTFIMFEGRIPTNVSVDRIDSSKDYTKDNIQLVCMAANQMKSDLKLDQLLYFCTKIIKKHENKN